MLRQVIVTIAISGFSLPTAAAQVPTDAQAWLIAPPVEEERPGPAVRWRVATESSSSLPILTPDDANRDRGISAIASQIDIYPFGDEFYLSAGTVTPLSGEAAQPWTRGSDRPAWSGFPHAELSEDVDRPNQIESLTRYFGAGVTVRTMDSWSMTVEGGAYFGDSGRDRMMMYDPDTGEEVPLLDDLDKIGHSAIGDRHARSVRPVAHLVLRRRF